jgi:hypothetical protein
MRAEGLCQRTNSGDYLSGIEIATFRLVAQYLNQLRHCVLQTLDSNMDNILAPFYRPAVDNYFVYFVKIPL